MCQGIRRFGWSDVRDGRSPFNIEHTGEYRDSTQQSSLARREQTIAPIERSYQSALSFRAGSPPSEQIEAIVELLQQATDAERLDARGGEFDGQGKSIETPTDLGDRRRVGIAELERLQPVSRALHKQLNGRESEGLLDIQVRRRRWRAQSRQPADTFSCDQQRLAAGGQDLHAPGGGEDTTCAGGGSV